MSVQKVTLKDLSAPVRSFLAQAKKRNGVLVEDSRGRALYGVIRYQEATPKNQAAALKRLTQLQRKVGAIMKRHGRTEADLDRLLQEENGS